MCDENHKFALGVLLLKVQHQKLERKLETRTPEGNVYTCRMKTESSWWKQDKDGANTQVSGQDERMESRHSISKRKRRWTCLLDTQSKVTKARACSAQDL